MPQEAKADELQEIMEPLVGEEPAETEAESVGGPTEREDDASPQPQARDTSAGKAEEIDPALLEQAQELGIEEEEARELGPSLKRTVALMERQFAKVGRERQQAPPPEQQRTTPERKKFELKLNKDLMDPEVAAALEAMHAHYEETVAGLQTKLDGVEGFHRAKAHEEFSQQFDTWIDELGDGYKPVFGKGRGDQVSKREQKARVEVIQEMDALAAGYNQTGRKVPGAKTLFERAVRQLHGDKAETVVRRRVSQQLRDRQGQYVARPSHRKTNQLRGEALAIANLTNRMRERGLLNAGHDDLQTVPE